MTFGLLGTLGFLGLVFGFGDPVIFPAKSIKELFEELAAIDMFHTTHTGDKPFDIAFAVGAEFVGGTVAVVPGAFARDDEAGIDDGTDERNAFVDGLLVLFLGMESKAKFAKEIFADDLDVAEKLGAAALRDDDKEVVDIATIVLITEVEAYETVELVKEDIGEEL